MKPASKYSHADFKHKLVDTVPPNKAVEIVVEIPGDAGWVVTLNYRGPNEESYTALPLAARGAQLAGEVPATTVVAGSFQYYLEVKDGDGKVVTRSGRRTSPNLVKIESTTVAIGPRSDDPLLDRRFDKPTRTPTKIFTPVTVSTGVAIVLIGGAVTTYLIAKQKGDDLRFDSMACGMPPCRPFDGFDRPLEDDCRKFNRIYQVTLVASVAAVGVAGYFWYRRLTTKRAERVAAKRSKPPWAFAPVLGDHTGAIAVRPF